MISGRRHPNVAQTKQLKLHLPLLSAVLHMVTSSVFRKRVVDRKFIYSLGSLLKVRETSVFLCCFYVVTVAICENKLS